MPELIEIELYRRSADAVVGSIIERVDLVDTAYLRGPGLPEQLVDALTGAVVSATGRRGKLALLHLDNGRTLGLRFGMTGRLVVGEDDPIAKLQYASGRDDPIWDRFILWFRPVAADSRSSDHRSDAPVDSVMFRINDPRRLGSVELDPDLARLGPDAESISLDALRAACRSDRPVKAVLLDQHRIAGLGNLLCDEVLWRCGIDPARSAGELDAERLALLRRTIRSTVRTLSNRGGSHRGDLQEHRTAGGVCPRDAELLVRRTIGGRTTYSCPSHQR